MFHFKFIALISLNSSESDVNIEDGLRFRPPNGFTDSLNSREFSDAECDRDLALDLEVQQCLANTNNNKLNLNNGKVQQNELTSLLSR